MKTRIFFSAILLGLIAPLSASEKDGGFVVHEWGTFTSVQGADGVQMVWNPLVVSQLPSFVYERNYVRSKNPRLLSAKTGMTCRQRMETPVIYFYSDRERTVDVSVNFPEGVVTEWYPLESAADVGLRATGQAKARPALRWERVEILPKADVKLPSDPSSSHYYAARETDAVLLRVATGERKFEIEKFLFYRGTGNFQAPLTVKLDSADARRVALQNTGTEELRHLFIYEVRDDGGSWVKIERLAPGESQSISIPGQRNSAPLTGLAPQLREALVSEGLYEREAAAMVKTWEASWFSEKGMRVLYTLPRVWTDRVLPLGVNPAPRETVRVMVGRAEIITPEMEQALLAQTERYVAASETDRPKIAADTRALGLGRFLEPALRRVMAGGGRTREFSSLSWELLQAATFPRKSLPN